MGYCHQNHGICQWHIAGKVDNWCNEIEVLTSIAHSQPHAAFAAFTHGLAEKWYFLSRTPPDIKADLQPLEDTIRAKLLPASTGCPPPNDVEGAFCPSCKARRAGSEQPSTACRIRTSSLPQDHQSTITLDTSPATLLYL